MGIKERLKGRSTNILFVILLFSVFIMCTLFTILIGAKVYSNIYARMQNNYQESITINYVINKVRQNNSADSIDVEDEDGHSVLKINQHDDNGEYVTKIYYLDGTLRELFTYADSDLTLQDGIVIMECPEVDFAIENNMVTINMPENSSGHVTLSVVSSEGKYE